MFQNEPYAYSGVKIFSCVAHSRTEERFYMSLFVWISLKTGDPLYRTVSTIMVDVQQIYLEGQIRNDWIYITVFMIYRPLSFLRLLVATTPGNVVE